MKLQDILAKSLKVSIGAIAADKELSRQIEIRLRELGLFDAPADGVFNKISIAALKKFQILTQSGEYDQLGSVTAKKLIETRSLPSTKIKLQNFLGTNLKYNYEAIATDKDLTKQIQVLLIGLELLDAPADGNFGPVSAAALRMFQELMQCGEPNYLGASTAEKLIEAKPDDIPTPPLKLGTDLASCIVKYMQSQGYKIFQGPKQYNIVYLEGMNADGSLNKDTPNQFNDRRMVIQILNGIPGIIGNWEATTEPGDYYTYYPMNDGGAARVKFGQYKAWQVGIHGNAEPHEALVQVGNISVYRDFNKDFSRAGDNTDAGLFGINQHWGYDMAYNDVHNASAGCLVGRAREGHREFMRIVKQDKRYQANNDYMFYTAVIPGDEVVKKFPPK